MIYDRVAMDTIAQAVCAADDGGIAPVIFAATVHKGDCTKDCHTCLVCEAEHYRALARAALDGLDAAGFTIVPPAVGVINAGDRKITTRARGQ